MRGRQGRGGRRRQLADGAPLLNAARIDAAAILG